MAVRDGKLVAANSDLLALTDEAAAAGGHPYIALVDPEETVLFRVRKAALILSGMRLNLPAAVVVCRPAASFSGSSAESVGRFHA